MGLGDDLKDLGLPRPLPRAALGSVDVRKLPRKEMGVYHVTDVIEFGASPTGGDSTEPVQRAIDETRDGGVIYFPQGLYVFEAAVVSRKCLTFVGDGACSVLQWLGGGPIFDFLECDDITLWDMAVDGRSFAHTARREGLPSALIVADGCRRFRVTRTRWDDSLDGRIPVLDETWQRPGLRFSGASREGRDVWFHDNFMNRYGIAAHNTSRIRIAANTIVRAAGHAVTVGSDGRDDSGSADVEIVGNSILDPHAFGIAAMDEGQRREEPSDLQPDPPRTTIGSRLERFRICGNTVRKRRGVIGAHFWHAIHVGTGPRVFGVDPGDRPARYRDLEISENECFSGQERELDGGPSHGIVLHLPTNQLNSDQQQQLIDGASFERAVIRGNGARGFTGDGIRVTNARYSVVANNGVLSCAGGLRLERNIFQNHIHRNRVLHTESDYIMRGSLGYNVMNGNVRLSGDGRARWDWEGVGRDRDRFYGTDLRAE